MFLGCFATIKAQVSDNAPEFLKNANAEVDGHQSRLDQYDGTADGSITLLSPSQSSAATALYIHLVDRIQRNIVNDPNHTDLEKKRLLTDLSNMLRSIDKQQYFLYNRYQRYFQMIVRVQEVIEKDRMIAILKSDLVTSLNIIPFYDSKPYAEDILTLAAQTHPSELLKHFNDFSYRDYSERVLNVVAQHAPMHVCFYMGTASHVYNIMRSSSGLKYIDKMKEIYEAVGSNSRAYLLLDDILNFRLTPREAHQKARDREVLFDHLMDLISSGNNIAGDFSVNDELTYYALRKVRQINALHEESDEVRFALVDSIPYTAKQLYTLMVYGEDELYTSSFLGLFKRFMARLPESGISSPYEFMHSLSMNQYRVFIKECAGYNTLSELLAKMSPWEQRSLFNLFVGGLDKEANPLEQAVAVADSYGSITNPEIRKQFVQALNKAYDEVRWSNKEAEKLYSLLLQITGIQTPAGQLVDQLETAINLKNESLFHQGEHIQQHFFFDDEDGWASYNTFIATFRDGSGHWTIDDQGTYVVIRSTQGKKVTIYANKAKEEYDGQDDLMNLFKKNNRYPEIVVHRGHSYYANTTIATLTPTANLVLLGSCGGYNNISTVLDYAPEAQIISSKQVGTMFVNNVMIYTLCEYLRSGKDLNWELVWPEIQSKVQGAIAKERFEDYIPPNQNMGALLIRTYRAML